ncbi:MAG: transposase [Verrucomicrobia bacterium]|nr:transposase [Verrucomicrobiota bacterium]MCH8517605.1 transposase [Cyclobacteriaceae bacterium]
MAYYNPEEPIDKHRRNLPHWQQEDVWVFVTWRLGDALPVSKLKALRAERDVWLKMHPEPWDEETEEEYHELFFHRVDKWLDQGIGSCLLRDERHTRIVYDALLHFQDLRYHLDCFVVMPNHVHALFSLGKGFRLDQVMKSWKGYTSREINRTRGTRGNLWQEEYWDRLIRSERHFHKVRKYILENPEKANLTDGFLLWKDELAHGQ